MERRHLRILYIPPGSSQYVLARSRSSVPISHLRHHNVNETSFATVSLKTCVETIHDSSPELFRDYNLDYSLYLLDPLESPTPVPSSSSSVGSSPPGVAVGLGLLSKIRRSGDQRVVTGTLMKDRTGLDALEVIFMLKETISMRKSEPEPVASDAETSARIAAALARQQNEQRMRARKVAQAHGGSATHQNFLQSGLTSSSSSLKGKERVSESKVFAFPSAAPSPNPASQASSSSTLPSPPSSEPASSPEHTPSATPDISAVLSAVTSNSDPDIQAQTLLAILNMIDTPGSGANPQFVTALREFASKIGLSSTHSPQRPQTPPTPQARPNTKVPSSPDDEVVVLDKENVNPTAFRRRAEREREDAKQIASSLGIGGSSNVPPRPTQGLSQSVRSNTTLSNDRVPPAPAPSTNTDSGGRKRTLSECLGSPKRDRGRTVRSVKGRSERSTSRSGTLIPDPHRHYSTRAAVPGDPWTSPPRSRRSNENSSPGICHGSSSKRPIVIPDSPLAPRVAASSPIRSSNKTQVRRRPYVVPQWARTETNLQPRLSETAMRALEQRQQEEKDRKRLQRKASKIQRTSSGPAVFRSPTSTSKAVSPPCPPPLTAAATDPLSSTPMPVIALPVNPIPFLASSSFLSRTRTPSPSPDSLPALPCTPPRKRARSYNGTPSPDLGDGSLFTPLSATPSSRRPIFEGSPLASKSPTVLRKARAAGDVENGKHNVISLNSTSPLCDADCSDSEDELERELHGVFSELECSSSALPIASSDFEVPEVGYDEGKAESSRPAEGESDTESDEESESYPKRQFWQGLPPSSPPAPSSPMLSPEDFSHSDRELPMVSSPTADNDEQESTSQSELADFSQITGSSVTFENTDANRLHNEIDVFDLLIQLGAVPSMGYTEGLNMNELNPDPDTNMSSDVPDQLDLTEFFRVMGPVLEDLPPEVVSEVGPDGNPTAGDRAFDKYVKAGQNIQSLLGGCVV